MIIGSHVSFKNGLLGSVKEALSYGANTFMYYTGAPQNTIRKELNKDNSNEAFKLMSDNNIDVNNIICHAPYIINLANKEKINQWHFSVEFLKKEIERCEELKTRYIVVHPGSAVNHSKEDALNNIKDGINEVLTKDTNVMILLETMAGKGTECGKTIDELKYLIDNTFYKNKIGICIDTCHLNDSGIDLHKFNDYLKEFDEKIGMEKIKCMHVNDSLNTIGSHKDRHANIGYGTIGFETLLSVIYNDKLKDVPKILETPYIGEYAPYKEEITEIKNKEFNPNLNEDYYKNL